MSSYEFQVVPAPERAMAATNLTKNQDQYCMTVTDILTDMGLAGWDFVGAETLPVRERRMFIFSRQSQKSCLVFRREIKKLAEPKHPALPTLERPELLEAPEPMRPVRPARIAVAPEFQSKRRTESAVDPVDRDAIARIPTRRKQPPLQLQDPIDVEPKLEAGDVIPIKLKKPPSAKDALSALERAMQLDAKQHQNA